MNLTIGATLTGGSVQTWNKLSTNGLKATFVAPSHTRLAPKTLEVGVGGGDATASNPGTARSTFKLVMADRQAEEGCCTTKAGSATFDGILRWDLTQPEALADDVIDAVRGFVYSTYFEDMVKKGMLGN